MSKSVILRDAKTSDFDALCNIMYNTWYVSVVEKADKKDVSALKELSRFDVAHYIETSTHVIVAVDPDNDGILGAIMWRNDTDWQRGISQKHLVHDELERLENLRRSDDNFAFFVRRFLDNDHRTEQLSADVASTCQAELRLFMIDPHARGRGVGKKLLGRAEESMKNSCVQRYYLYTDSDCDYSFYDYRGMTREVEKFNVPGWADEAMDKFVYTAQLN